MFNISNLEISNSAVLAPMAGITDHPFRQICKSFGAGLVYTEFVSADGIIRENKKTLDMIKFDESERPIGVQIFGDDPEVVAGSAVYINKHFKPDIIDINYGCPVPKVTKRGAGSAALKDLCIMQDITEAVVESVFPTPVTVKMRTGWNADNVVSTKAGMLLESIGVKAIALHGRTTSQKFTGCADWTYIKELKEAVNIPVIGNGDVSSFEDYKKIKEFTNCDAVMIGRAALGNPWIFSNILNSNDKKPNIDEIKKVCLKHIELLIENKSEKVSLNLSKKHLSYYLKNFDQAGLFRKDVMRCDDIKQVIKIISSI
ncbi:MAG: tRNA dihydrouridine synthase DusB [Candidatus Marinimicrobia bacterium]|nr:tRNA dihydrouridine synthase DusB [Candidatus Neomarinimicrobiota bacterium]|tara:strand:- start:15173 stop:16117 length:945 start_codon:yes stop_codon:yes gene_type:complete